MITLNIRILYFRMVVFLKMLFCLILARKYGKTFRQIFLTSTNNHNSGNRNHYVNLKNRYMDLHRRNFFKVMGITGITLAIGKELKASPKSISDTEFHGVLYD